MNHIKHISFTLFLLSICFTSLMAQSPGFGDNTNCPTYLSELSCGDTFGPATYDNNAQQAVQVCSSDGSNISITITTNTVEAIFDQFEVYSGANYYDDPSFLGLGDENGIDSDGDLLIDAPATGVTFNSAEPCITVLVISDGSVNGDLGFSISCASGSTAGGPPTIPVTGGPTNDDCADALLLANNTPTAISNVNATSGSGDGTCEDGGTPIIPSDAGQATLENTIWLQYCTGANPGTYGGHGVVDYSACSAGGVNGDGTGTPGTDIGVGTSPLFTGGCGNLTDAGLTVGDALAANTCYYFAHDGNTGAECDFRVAFTENLACDIGADQGDDVEYCFGATPNPISTDANADFTGFDAGPNATANAGVAYAEICGEYDPVDNTTTGDPTSNPNYTGFIVGTAYTYNTGTATGTDGEGNGCDYLTLVPLTYIDIDAVSGEFILDTDVANICVGTPIRLDFRPEITVSGAYDCGTSSITLTVAGGAQDDGVAGTGADGTATVVGDYTLSGDVTGTTASDQITLSNLGDGTYSYTITDADGCTQTASFTVNCGCPLSLTAETVACVTQTAGNDDYTVTFDFSGGPVTDLVITPAPDAGSDDPTVDATGTLTFTFTEPNNYNITLNNNGGAGTCDFTVMGNAPSCVDGCAADNGTPAFN